jgi:uncharacterized protein (DUF433 family)
MDLVQIYLYPNPPRQRERGVGGESRIETLRHRSGIRVIFDELRPGYRGGRAIITGTNFPVSSVVTYILHQGMIPEELARSFSHLTLAQVYYALLYSCDHQTEIDAELKKNLSRDA